MENQSTEEKKGGKCGGDYKHLVLGKFTQETTQQEIDDLIKGYANLVSLVPPMISFRWYITHHLFLLLKRNVKYIIYNFSDFILSWS